MLTLHEEIAGEIATQDGEFAIGAGEARALGMPEGAYRRVATQVVSEHRWYTKRLIVFEYDGGSAGGRYGFHYLDPATEEQEDQDRFEADPVPTFEVVGREVTTTVYEEAK